MTAGVDALNAGMKPALSLLASVPGVAGSIVCDWQGRLLGHALRSPFEASVLEEVSRSVADGALGLGLEPGSSGMLDFRYREARIVVKALPRAMLVVLCRRAVNVQLVLISASVIAGKLARLEAAVPAQAAATPGPAPAAPPPALAQATPAPPAAAAAKAPSVGPAGPTQELETTRKHVPVPVKGLEELRRRLGKARS